MHMTNIYTISGSSWVWVLDLLVVFWSFGFDLRYGLGPGRTVTVWSAAIEIKTAKKS